MILLTTQLALKKNISIPLKNKEYYILIIDNIQLIMLKKNNIKHNIAK